MYSIPCTQAYNDQTIK